MAASQHRRPCRPLRINTLELFFESEDVKSLQKVSKKVSKKVSRKSPESPESLQNLQNLQNYFLRLLILEILEILETFWRLSGDFFGDFRIYRKKSTSGCPSIAECQRGSRIDAVVNAVRLSRNVNGVRIDAVVMAASQHRRPCRPLRINTLELFFESEDVKSLQKVSKKSPKKSPESLQNLQKVSKISRISKIIFCVC